MRLPQFPKPKVTELMVMSFRKLRMHHTVISDGWFFVLFWFVFSTLTENTAWFIFDSISFKL